MNEGNDSKYGQVQDVGNSTNVSWHKSTIHKTDIHKKNNHRSAILWFTGLSGSGKSTLANAVNAELFKKSINSYVLDGDNIRHGINQDLGFTDQDRKENIRRISHVASLFLDAGLIVLTAFVSPFRSDREKCRKMVEADEFIEVYCNADLKACEGRDTKGLYKKARQGIINDFTGIDSPYEEPESPELSVDTNGTKSLDECVEQVLKYLELKGVIPR